MRTRGAATSGRQKGKYRQATRLLRLLEYLRSRRYGATLSDLAQEMAVTERQIRRDLAALEEAGFAATLSLSRDGRTTVQLPGERGRGVQLTLRERYGLLAARRVFDALDGTPFHEDVRSIYSKVAASLPDAQRADLEKFGQRFLYVPDGGTKAYGGKEDVLDALLTGVIHRSKVRYRYTSAANESRAGVLDPYSMLPYKHGLYVIGCGAVDGKPPDSSPHVFAAERFEDAEHLRGEHFEVPASFRLDDFFQGSFGIFIGGAVEKVTVDFDAGVRSRVEARKWHETQKARTLPGGGVRLTFQASNLTQVVPWVLGWGAHARVVEPPELVRKVAEALRVAAAHYAFG